jgi:hypothetical protein
MIASFLIGRSFFVLRAYPVLSVLFSLVIDDLSFLLNVEDFHFYSDNLVLEGDFYTGCDFELVYDQWPFTQSEEITSHV